MYAWWSGLWRRLTAGRLRGDAEAGTAPDEPEWDGPTWDEPPATIEDFRDRLHRIGLSEQNVEGLAGLARPSIRLVPDPAGDVTRTGTTRAGGDPDLPPDVAWPLMDGRPLSFVAQIRLDDLPSGAASADLPDRGLLSFFYDAVEQPWGFDPAHRGSWAVQHSPGDGPWERRPAPPDLAEDGRFTPVGLGAVAELCFPPGASHDVESLPFEVPWEGYNHVLAAREETLHRLLGHPDPVQEDMQRECQLAGNGVYCGGTGHLSDPAAQALLAGAGDWRLLLQLDSSDETGMTWGDWGRIYYWIRDQDLRDRAWDRAWLVLQCG